MFEVDHPASQQWKRQRLAAAGIAIPDNVRLVPVDFESVTLAEGLSAAGLDFAGPTFFALLGVSQYLTEASLELTLRFVLSMPASSEIVLSFVLPRLLGRRTRRRWSPRLRLAPPRWASPG